MKPLSLLFILFSLFIPFTSLQANNEDLFSIVETSRKMASPIAYAVEIERPDVVKFLIDMNEDVNRPTPGTPVYFIKFGPPGNEHYDDIADEPGKTPVEIAIEKNNLELLTILLYDHPTNSANVEYEVLRYHPQNLRKFKNGFASSEYYPQVRSSPLIIAMKGKNHVIVDMIMKAYRTLDKLSDAFPYVKRESNKDFMRFWIAQTVKLWKNEEVEVPEEVAELFLTKTLNQSIQEHDYETLSLLTEYGMLINKEEFQAAIATQDSDLIALLFNKGRMNPNFDPAEMLLNNHLDHLIDLSDLKNLTSSIARLDRIDLLESVIDEMDETMRLECSLIAAKEGSIQVLQFLSLLAVPMDQALLQSIQSNQHESFLLLIEQPLKEDTRSDAITLAYHLHRYDMLTALLEHN